MHYKYDFYPNSQNFHKNFKNFMAFLLKDCSINKSTIKSTTQPKTNEILLSTLNTPPNSNPTLSSMLPYMPMQNIMKGKSKGGKKRVTPLVW